MVRATPAPVDGMWLTPSNVCCGFAGAVDKRGRALARDAGAQELSKLYRVEGNDDAPENVDIEGKARATATRDIIMNKKLERLNAMARGEIAFEGSSSDDDSDSSDSSEDVDLAVDDEILKLPEAARGEAPRTTMEGQETSRLAAVNMDWEHITAVDIFAALQVRWPWYDELSGC